MDVDEIIASMGLYDYSGNKLCELYDSQNNIRGQAYGISFTENMKDGIKTLNFSIPYMVDDQENFRWAFLKSEYLIKLVYNGRVMWYIATQPKKSKSGKEIIGTVSCKGKEFSLRTKNIYMTFDDTNGIGTINELVDRILAGTGWSREWADPMLEADGVTEKIRSLSSGDKTGALGLMTKVCNLFKCYPVYDSDSQTVALYNFNNRTQVLEAVVGKNLNAINVDYNSDDIVTRLYVEGEYGDNGYVGIDDVNPTGLNYIMNFDYYREIGVMNDAHEQALNTYTTNVSNIKRLIRDGVAERLEIEDQINKLIGQSPVALYYTANGFASPTYVYNNPSVEDRALAHGDKVVVLNNNGTFRYETIATTAQELIKSGDYAIAKFITPAAGTIGAKEVQIDAKEKRIADLDRLIEKTTKEDRIAEYNREKKQLQTEAKNIKAGVNHDTILAEMNALYPNSNVDFASFDVVETRDVKSQGYDLGPRQYETIAIPLQPYYFSAEDANQQKAHAAEQMTAQFPRSNADLLHRTMVPAEQMHASGWEDIDDDSYATLYSLTYSAGNGGDFQWKNRIILDITPISN